MCEVYRNHIHAAHYCARCIVIGRITGNQGDGAEADNDDQCVPYADKTRGIKNTLARSLDVTDGEEPHENVWKTCRAED